MAGEAERPGPAAGPAGPPPSSGTEAIAVPTAVLNPDDKSGIADILAKMPDVTTVIVPKSQKVVRAGLWAASPIAARDLPALEELAKAMFESGVALVAAALPRDISLKGNISSIKTHRDFIELFESINIYIIILYGLLNENAEFPRKMLVNAHTRTNLIHLALIMASQAGKDSFLIVPRALKSPWRLSRVEGDSLPDRDAVWASNMYRRKISVGHSEIGDNLREFCEVERIRFLSAGPADIRSHVE